MRFAALRKAIHRFHPFYPVGRHYYHLWYYNTKVWATTSWMGVGTLKSPMDMWNYQEILVALQPSMIVEFGTWCGGSALFFASVMRQIGKPFVVYSVDISHARVSDKAKSDPNLRLVTKSSASEEVRHQIAALRRDYRGPMFAILDSDHSKDHVLAEMKNMRDVMVAGDYMVVEDSNLNGHPVDRSFGPGPYEAIEEYFRLFPNDYEHDLERERRFGFTFATNGFLRRK